MKKNNLVIYLVLLVVAYLYFSGVFFRDSVDPITTDKDGKDNQIQREATVGEAPVLNNQSAVTSSGNTELPKDIIDASRKPESNNPQDLPPDLKAQLEAPPPELPEDLKRQLEMGPQELPEDLKAQLAAPPPPLPDDIANALKVPPRVVTIDEVNTPPEAREDEEDL